ncbi:heat-shock protein 70 [Pelomyxa schiedti]|nr:heat-shock protein 70 [Pelomyxa schiedti]
MASADQTVGTAAPTASTTSATTSTPPLPAEQQTAAAAATTEQRCAPLVAFDIGNQTSVVAVSIHKDKLPLIISNNLSNQVTPSLVGFDGDKRVVGEDAFDLQVRQPSMCCGNIKQLLLQKNISQISLWCNCPATPTPVPPGFTLTLGGNEYLPQQILAMLLSRLGGFARNELPADSLPLEECVLAVPLSFKEQEIHCVVDAAKISGFTPIAVVHDFTCVAVHYAFRHPTPEGKESVVLFLDQGHTHTTAAVAKFTPNSLTILSAVCDETLGGVSIDNKLIEHIVQKFKDMNARVTTNPNVRAIARLRRAVEKAKHILSTIPSTDVAVDSFVEDTDLRMVLSRASMDELCSAELERLQQVIQSAIQSSGVPVEGIDHIEIVGGGFRSPSIVSAAQKAISVEKPILRSLDSASSVALGAATLGQILSKRFGQSLVVEDKYNTYNTELLGSPEGDLFRHKEVEKALNLKDSQLAQLQSKRNEMEGYLYSTREECNNSVASAPPPTSTPSTAKVVMSPQEKEGLLNALQEAEWWLSDNPNATLPELDNYLTSLKQKTKELCPALVAHREAIEAEKLKALQEAANAKPVFLGTKKPEPRTKSEKLDAANKKKEAGNKLVRDNDYENAAARYFQAVGFLQSMFDLSAEEKQNVDDLLCTLYLNLSLCYLKLDKPQKAIENCHKVVEKQSTNVKALFRRGQAYRQTKEYELAKKDLEAGLKLEPGNLAIKKELTLVQAGLDQEHQRQKKMAKAMFSGLNE